MERPAKHMGSEALDDDDSPLEGEGRIFIKDHEICLKEVREGGGQTPASALYDMCGVK